MEREVGEGTEAEDRVVHFHAVPGGAGVDVGVTRVDVGVTCVDVGAWLSLVGGKEERARWCANGCVAIPPCNLVCVCV